MSEVLKFDDVNFYYSGGKGNHESINEFALKNISFNADEGDFISIIGKNGSGKSTLIKLFSKILVGYSGNIFYKAKEIHSIDRKEFSRNVSYLPQSAATFNEDLKVKEFLLLGRYAHKQFTDFRFSDDDKKIVEAGICETSIENLADRKMYELSGGEKQKVLITLALVQLDITKNLDGKVLIIDEPLTYLDVNYQFEIFSILKNLRNRNLTVIIVIHDLNLALRFSGKTILMSKGQMIKYSESKDVITEETLREYFMIESKIVDLEKNYFINYLQ